MRRIDTDSIQDFEKQHIETARRLAPEGAVLLKNEGILPLTETGKLAAYGSGVRKTIKGGTGSGDVNVRHFVTIEEGLQNAGFEITTKEWIDAYDEIVTEKRAAWISEIKQKYKALGQNPVFAAMGSVMPEPDYELPLNGEGDTAIYVLSRISGEGNDRRPEAGDINLTETEIRDIRALNKKYQKFILILNVGGMVNLAPVEKEVKAILLLGQLGTVTGDVCADLLLGKSSPSGKLAMTWAAIEQYPSTEGFGDMNDTRYREGIYVGYRYFDTFGRKPIYPFGYGLGYTEFSLSVSECRADEEKVSVTVLVKNTGSFSGKEVVQVYVSAPSGELDRPYQELKGFAKSRELAAGETQELTVVFPTVSMAAFSERKSAYILEKGDYTIRVGNCSDHTIPAGIITVEQERITEQVKPICPGVDFKDLVPETVKAEIPENVVRIKIDSAKIDTKTAAYRETPEEIKKTETVSWAEVISGEKTTEEFIGGLSEEQLADLCVGNYAKEEEDQSVIGQACTAVAGGAGETTGHLKELGLDRLSMCDGPAGIRVDTSYKLVNGRAKGQGSALASLMDFMDEEEIQMIEAMAANKSREELEAPTYYQYCVAIPIGTALAQSFNVELCEELGDMIGEEMELFGCDLWLAPALNIQRSPLCGRNFEYYSEDPLVSGKIAAAITRGVQKHPGCGTTIKHFAANNQETNRYGSNSIMSERALREIYLKGFEIAVKESRPASLMTSYNLINGEHSCNSRDLNTFVLRDEWGYQGLVMTDWLVTRSLMTNPNAKYGPASAAGCVKSGNHVTMPGSAEDREDILKALDDENHPYHLTRAELQNAAKSVLENIRVLKHS
ncbi:MAG: glycoside hydrolase family 3 C-terminal domain-containing protein [Eubacteriales bacterium]|nr:glycoside hydrolase family 3 C-terminal domain-containing protein [Eubacteriales bacterium]